MEISPITGPYPNFTSLNTPIPALRQTGPYNAGRFAWLRLTFNKAHLLVINYKQLTESRPKAAWAVFFFAAIPFWTSYLARFCIAQG